MLEIIIEGSVMEERDGRWSEEFGIYWRRKSGHALVKYYMLFSRKQGKSLYPVSAGRLFFWKFLCTNI